MRADGIVKRKQPGESIGGGKNSTLVRSYDDVAQARQASLRPAEFSAIGCFAGRNPQMWLSFFS